jgi:alpha-D-xyloside xylohydrolase
MMLLSVGNVRMLSPLGAGGSGGLLNQPIDISDDFQQLENEYFIPGEVKEYDVEKGEGKLQWNFHRWTLDWFFNKIDKHLEYQETKNAPFQDYDTHPQCYFSITFVNQRTIRLRMKTTTSPQVAHPTIILHEEPAMDHSWQTEDSAEWVRYKGGYGSVVLNKKVWQLEVHDACGKLLMGTQSTAELKAMHSKAMPFLFMRRSSDYSRSLAASFTLLPGERIYGCGESFTSLNKRGQKVVLWTTDTQSTASQQMYKPIPFFMSNRGYGMFVHTSSPVTIDFGFTHDGSKTIYVGEDYLDLFIFIGTPEEILKEYTALTGKSPLPPLWSFGLWMSRFSYRSQDEVKMVADNLRKHSIPCDVIHIDAGWFKKGINCDFEFCKDTFPEPERMTSELKEKGFRTTLWQIPYFTPLNPIYAEVVQKQLYVKDGNGNVTNEDAILDFSNTDTIEWYTEKIKALLQQGISAIKVDFGEAAPYKGYYASGRTGFYEHNLYPLRYNQLVSEITKEVTGENIIWARSAWAGSQRYPLHWGGDAEVSDTGMAGTIRGGLSLGLSGFSFWSHDIGGFSGSPKEELFQRWAFFGLLSSHSRVHGFPPREPWEFSERFQNTFRKITELRYRLMPYIYTQAAIASEQGPPVLKALFLNYPDDPTAWMVEDQYLLGNCLLVAPLMEENINSRKVYLPEGKWVDYQTKKIYEGKQWSVIEAVELPGILLVKWGSLIPHIALVQSTEFMDWQKIELVAFSNGEATAKGEFYIPVTKQIISLESAKFGEEWELMSDTPEEVVEFSVRSF